MLNKDDLQKSFRISPEQADQINGLINGTVDPQNFSAVEAWVRSCWGMPKHDELVMCAINQIIEGCGVEGLPVEGAWIDSYHHNFIASYVNTGDTYSPTILLDHENEEYLLTTLGDFLEQWEIEHDPFKNSFMKPEVTCKQLWYQVEDEIGEIYIYPAELFGTIELLKEHGEDSEIETISGYGARLSAPGYLDCTDWTLHDSEEEALEYLIETYGNNC